MSTALLVLASVRLAGASHQASLTKAELACQAGTAKAMGVFTVARAKCLITERSVLI